MSLDMLPAEYHGREALDADQQLSMADEGFDDITFDDEAPESRHEAGVDGRLDYDVNDDLAAHGQGFDHESISSGEQDLDLGNAGDRQDGTDINLVAAHGGEPEPEVAEALDDSGVQPDLDDDDVSASPVAGRPVPDADDLASDIDFDRADDVSLDGAEESKVIEHSGSDDLGTASREAMQADEDRYEGGQSLADLDAVQHQSPKSEQSQGYVPETSTSAAAGVTPLQGDDGEDYGLGATGHDDAALIHSPDQESDGHDTISQGRTDLQTEALAQQHLVAGAEEDHKEHGHNDEDMEDMDVAEHDSSSSEFSTRPLVRVRYRDTMYSLFSAADSDDPYSYFFSDVEALDYPLSQFLAGLREVLSEELTAEDELVIRIEGLGLEFAETMDKASLDRTTFGAIVELFDQLVKADNADSQDHVLLVYLVTRPNCMRRLDALLDGANIGEGLAAYYMSYPDYLLRDFPARSNAKDPLADGTPRAVTDDGDDHLESNRGADEADGHGDAEEDPRYPGQTGDSSAWDGSRDYVEEVESSVDGSSDQVIDEGHPVPHQLSPGDPEAHEADSRPVGGRKPDSASREGAASETEGDPLNKASNITQSDPRANHGSVGGDGGNEVSSTGDDGEHAAGSDGQDRSPDGTPVAPDPTEVEQDPDGEDGPAEEYSDIADADDDELGRWDDDARDSGASASTIGEGQAEVAAADLREGHTIQPQTSTPAPGDDWDAHAVQDDLEAISTNHEEFELLHEDFEVSAEEAAHTVVSEQTSASGTLDGDEINLDEVLGAVTSTADDGAPLNDDSLTSSYKEHPEADEIDWDDNDNGAAVIEAQTSTPSSNTGKRNRDEEDGEGLGDGHDVKRHRA